MLCHCVKPIHVIMICGEFPPLISGVGDYTARLAKALASRGHKITFVTSRVRGASDTEYVDGVAVQRRMSQWGLLDIRHILRETHRNATPTIVHIQYPCSSHHHRRLMINFLPLILRVVSKCKVVVTMHEFKEMRIRWRLRILPMLAFAHRLIFVNPNDQKSASRSLPAINNCSRYIPIASNIEPDRQGLAERDAVRADLGVPRENIIVAFFGGIIPPKAFPDLLDAIKLVRIRHRHVNLLVIGGFQPKLKFKPYIDYQNHVRGLMQQAERENWLWAVDAPTQRDVSRYLYASDICAFPYTEGARENRGSLLAALRHGIATVSTEGDSTPAGFAARFGVRLVSPRDVKQLAHAVRELIESPKKRRKLGDQGRAATRDLTWDSIAQRTEQVYSSLLDGNKNAH